MKGVDQDGGLCVKDQGRALRRVGNSLCCSGQVDAAAWAGITISPKLGLIDTVDASPWTTPITSGILSQALNLPQDTAATGQGAV